MRHVKLYKKRGVPGIIRVEDHDNGIVIELKKGEFDEMTGISDLKKKLKAKKAEIAKQHQRR